MDIAKRITNAKFDELVRTTCQHDKHGVGTARRKLIRKAKRIGLRQEAAEHFESQE
jgi:hypothetical protein